MLLEEDAHRHSAEGTTVGAPAPARGERPLVDVMREEMERLAFEAWVEPEGGPVVFSFRCSKALLERFHRENEALIARRDDGSIGSLDWDDSGLIWIGHEEAAPLDDEKELIEAARRMFGVPTSINVYVGNGHEAIIDLDRLTWANGATGEERDLDALRRRMALPPNARRWLMKLERVLGLTHDGIPVDRGALIFRQIVAAAIDNDWLWKDDAATA